MWLFQVTFYVLYHLSYALHIIVYSSYFTLLFKVRGSEATHCLILRFIIYVHNESLLHCSSPMNFCIFLYSSALSSLPSLEVLWIGNFMISFYRWGNVLYQLWARFFEKFFKVQKYLFSGLDSVYTLSNKYDTGDFYFSERLIFSGGIL